MSGRLAGAGDQTAAQELGWEFLRNSGQSHAMYGWTDPTGYTHTVVGYGVHTNSDKNSWNYKETAKRMNRCMSGACSHAGAGGRPALPDQEALPGAPVVRAGQRVEFGGQQWQVQEIYDGVAWMFNVDTGQEEMAPVQNLRAAGWRRLAMPYHDNTWYHVTDRSRLPEIQQHGLRGRSHGHDPAWSEYPADEDAVYLWPNVGLAHQYPSEYTWNRWEDPVMLRVRGLDYNNLAPDHEGAMTNYLEGLADSDSWLEPDDPQQEIKAWIDAWEASHPLPVEEEGSAFPHYYQNIRMLRDMPAEMREEVARISASSADAVMHYGPIHPSQIEVANLHKGDDFEGDWERWQDQHPQEWTDEERDNGDDTDAFYQWQDQQPYMSEEDLENMESGVYDDPEDDSYTHRFNWQPLAPQDPRGQPPLEQRTASVGEPQVGERYIRVNPNFRDPLEHWVVIWEVVDRQPDTVTIRIVSIPDDSGPQSRAQVGQDYSIPLQHWRDRLASYLWPVDDAALLQGDLPPWVHMRAQSKIADADHWTTPAADRVNEHVNMPGEAPGMQDPAHLPHIRVPCFCDVGLTSPHEWGGTCENGRRPTFRHEAALGQNWVYLNGDVEFGQHWWDIARELARKQEMDPMTQNYISNMIARNSLPTDQDCAVGSVRNGKPQIWVSTSDRNHVYDQVMDRMPSV